MNKLKQMQTFTLAIEEGSIVQAARLLGISKAAASKQIIELEKELNIRLMNRTTRSLELTDTGQLYYEALKKVFFAIADAESVINQSYNKPKGLLRISSNSHFGEKFIIDNLNEWIALYPDLKLDIELADRFPNMEKEGIDLLCGISQEGPDHLVRKRITTANHILCASPDYLDKWGIPKTPADLKQHRFITHSSRKADVLSFYNYHDVYVDFNIRLNDAQAMMKCALQGLGFIKIFHYFVNEQIKRGELIEILKEYREPPKALYIFYQQQKYMPAKLRLFIDFLCQKVEEENQYFSIQ